MYWTNLISEMYVSIIGSREFTNCDKSRYDDIVYFAINELNKLDTSIILMSGGAAWADHIAVSIWKLYQSDRDLFTCNIEDIILHLPAPITRNGYTNNKYGSLSNYYHLQFSNIVEFNSLNDIYLLSDKCKVYNGFHQRNNEVSKCDVLFAFTDTYTMGKGTSYTWNKCKQEAKYQFIVNE